MRKNYPLRIDAELFDAIKRWADDEFRSANGQIEFLLRQALTESGRVSTKTLSDIPPANHPEESPSD